MNKMQALTAYVKSDSDGMLKIAKHIVGGGEVVLSEAQFTTIATEAAKKAYPDDRPDKAFSKYFEGNLVVRQAHAVVKGMATIMPVATANEGTDDDDEDALEALEELAERQRAAHPELSKAAAFSKIYQDPANVELVKRERRQARAGLSAA